MRHIYTMQYHSVIKKNELLPFAIRQMHLEAVAPNEISQTENDKFVWLHLDVESKKHKKEWI